MPPRKPSLVVLKNKLSINTTSQMGIDVNVVSNVELLATCVKSTSFQVGKNFYKQELGMVNTTDFQVGKGKIL